jgi:large subunit ribosomal protein L18
MAHKSTYKVLFKRRRSGKTNYAKRVSLLRPKTSRMVIRKSNALIRTQIVAYDATGDRTVCAAISTELPTLGWKYNPKNLGSAYLTGFLLGTRAKAAKVEKAVVDLGLHTPMHGGRLFAAVKGARDAGLSIPVSEDVLPDAKRLSQKREAEFAQAKQMIEKETVKEKKSK